MGIFNSKNKTPTSSFISVNVKGFVVTDFDGGGDEGSAVSDLTYDKFLGRILSSGATQENTSPLLGFLSNIKSINL